MIFDGVRGGLPASAAITPATMLPRAGRGEEGNVRRSHEGSGASENAVPLRVASDGSVTDITVYPDGNRAPPHRRMHEDPHVKDPELRQRRARPGSGHTAAGHRRAAGDRPLAHPPAAAPSAGG